MYQKSGCCMLPNNKKDDCCCKDGILCALDWFFQDFLVKPTNRNCIETGTLKYYPKLQDLSTSPISNIIYNIPYITTDIVPIYIDSYIVEPYTGDISYLNICKLYGFEFQISSTCTVMKEADITSRFCKIHYSSSNGCCCKNGTLEYLLKARDFLLNLPTTNSVILSTPANSFRVTKILAINSDTVWAKNIVIDPITGDPTTIYYVLSLCELIGITLSKTI